MSADTSTSIENIQNQIDSERNQLSQIYKTSQLIAQNANEHREAIGLEKLSGLPVFGMITAGALKSKGGQVLLNKLGSKVKSTVEDFMESPEQGIKGLLNRFDVRLPNLGNRSQFIRDRLQAENPDSELIEMNPLNHSEIENTLQYRRLIDEQGFSRGSDPYQDVARRQLERENPDSDVIEMDELNPDDLLADDAEIRGSDLFRDARTGEEQEQQQDENEDEDEFFDSQEQQQTEQEQQSEQVNEGEQFEHSENENIPETENQGLDSSGGIEGTTADIGADIGTDAAIEGTEIGTDAAVEAAGLALDSTGILAPLGIALGVGGALFTGISGLEDLFGHHEKAQPPQAPPLVQRQVGI